MSDSSDDVFAKIVQDSEQPADPFADIVKKSESKRYGLEYGKKQAKTVLGGLEVLAAGVGDLANSAVSGATGLYKASIAKAAGLPFQETFKEEFDKSYNGVANAIPYLPETEEGKAMFTAVGDVFHKVIQGIGDEAFILPTRIPSNPTTRSLGAALGVDIEKPSPALGAAAQAAAVAATLGLGKKATQTKPKPHPKAPELGTLKNAEGGVYENWDDPTYVERWAKENYPATLEQLQAGSVGKLIRDEYKSLDVYDKLHSVLNTELQLKDGGGLPLTQKFYNYLDKIDPEGKVPAPDRLKIINSTLAQLDDLNRLANLNMTPEQLVAARLIRPQQSPANIIKRQFNIKSEKEIQQTAAEREADFKVALKEKVGYVIDPVTQIERPLTAGEYFAIKTQKIERPQPQASTGVYESDPVSGVVVKELSIEEFRSYQQPKTEVPLRDEVPKVSRITGKTTPNASGESAASAESISRLRDQNAKGIEQYIVDPERNQVIPLRTVDRVDQRAADGKVIVERDAKGKFTILQNKSRLPDSGALARSQKLVIEQRQARKAEAAANKEVGVKASVIPFKAKPGGKQSGVILNETPEAIAANTDAIKKLQDETATVTAAGLLTPNRYQELTKAFDEGRDYPAPKQGLKDKIITKGFDVSGPVKFALEAQGPEGLKAKRRFNLVRGAHSRAMTIFDENWKSIVKGVDHETLSNAEKLVAARTIVAIDIRKGPGQIRHVKGTNAAEMDAFANNMKAEIGAEKFNRANEVANKVFMAYKKQLSDAHDAGLLTDDSYIAMHNIEYSPTEYLSMLDPEHVFNFKGETVTVRDSGIQTIGKGSEDLMRVDMKGLLAEAVLRMQSRILKNEASKALYEFAEKIPNNGFVQAVKPESWDNFGVAQKVKQAPEGYTRIDSLIDGKQHPMYLREDFANQWVRQKTEISAELAAQLRFWSGSSIIKTLATSLNPIFPLVSFPKDMMHIWTVNEAQYSAQLPIYAAQMGKDLMTVLPDTLMRKGRWLDYAREGGMQEVMSQQGPSAIAFGSNPISKMTHTTARNATEAVGFLGTFFENWPRLALRERAIKNGAEPWEASAQAREYLDFAEGGSYIKALDAFSPYLAASVQGTYTVGKAIVRDPKATAWKAAQFLGVSGAATLVLMKSNPEAWNQIPERDRINNFIIAPKGMFIIDPYGTKRNVYFQLPIDQSYVPLHALMIASFDKSLNGVNPSGELFKEINKGTNPLSGIGVPSYDAIQTYRSNYAFWKDDSIWKGAKVKPEDEIIPGYRSGATPEALVRIGEATGMSPERLRAAISTIAPSNPYTNLMGEGLQQWLEGATDYDKSQATIKIIKELGLGRFVKLTHPFESEVKSLELAEADFNSAKGKQVNAINTMIFRESQGEGKAQDAFKSWISTQPPEEVENLTNQFVGRYITDKVFRQLKIDGSEVPSRTWWQATLAAPPEVRAAVFYNEWVRRDKTGRGQMNRVSAAMGAAGKTYRGEKFELEFGKQINMLGDDKR